MCIISVVMLNKLFSSTVRADILALLLNSPEEKFYVREIATILGKNPSGVKRELDNLEKMGILVSERVANLKYFRANRKSPLFNELKSLITKSLGLPGALKSVLRASGVKIAFIYGNYVEGQDSEDVDLLVIGGLTSLNETLKELEKEFSVRINLRQLSEADYEKYKRDMPEDLKPVFEAKKIILLGRL